MRKISTKNKIMVLVQSLRKTYPEAHCALNFKNPLQLLIATILSAQCTDKRVNAVTPALFARYQTAADFADADREELIALIKSTGFYRNKARSISGSAALIQSQFGGRVPDSMNELLKLPGVARKTANVVLYNAFDKNEGIAVDTHVLRTAQRLGLTASDKPLQVERDLMELLPPSEWGHFSHLLIELGRDVCKAPRPYCKKCRISMLCPWYKQHPESVKA